MRETKNLASVLVNVTAISLTLFCLLLGWGTLALSGEPVQLPSLGIIPPEPGKSGHEVKGPVEATSLGVTTLKPSATEKQPTKPVQLPSLGK